MVEKIDAEGKYYQKVLEDLGRGNNFLSPVFYLDGDETKGEPNLGHLRESLQRLSLVPDVDGCTLWITDSRDLAGRELHALSLPVESIDILVQPDQGNANKEPVVKNRVTKEKVLAGSHRLVEGTTFGVFTRSITNRSNSKLIMVISEDKSEEEASIIAAEKFSRFSNYPVSQIETIPRLVTPDEFWLEVKRQIDAGVRFPLYILRRCNLVEYEENMQRRISQKRFSLR